MVEIRDGTIKDVLEKLRRPGCEIKEINRRCDLFDRRRNSRWLQNKVDRHEAGMI